MSNLKTIARYGHELEADYYRTLLAEHGISSYISNARIAESLSANIVGGVQLRCSENDYEVAKRLVDKVSQEKRQRRQHLKNQPFMFHCEECGAEILVTADRCGFVETCPSCKQYVDVPALEGGDEDGK